MVASCRSVLRSYCIPPVVSVTSIGLTVGCEVQVLQNVRKRPVLVYGRDSVIAVDAEDCARIDVQVRS